MDITDLLLIDNSYDTAEKAKAEIERLREHCDRMASLAIDNARDTERLREALKTIARFSEEWGAFAEAALQ